MRQAPQDAHGALADAPSPPRHEAPANDALRGVPRAAAQQDALDPHHARHHHRRGRRDRHGERRAGREHRRPEADREPRHQPPDGHAWVDDRRRRRVPDGAACRPSRSQDATAIKRECRVDQRHHRTFAARACRSSTATRTGPRPLRAPRPSSPRCATGTPSAGSFFTARDDSTANRVVVIGQTVASQLFGEGEDPIGAQVPHPRGALHRDRGARGQRAIGLRARPGRRRADALQHGRATRPRREIRPAPST